VSRRNEEPDFSNDDTAKCCRCSDHFDVEMMETKDCIEFVCADCKAGAADAKRAELKDEGL